MADMIRKSTHTTAETDAAVDMIFEMYTREEIDNLLSQKITAIPGKGLSTNDFTDADKSKLDDLENYDDSNVKADISGISSQAALNQSTLGYQRKNLLKNTAKSQTINGVTFTVNEDGSVTTNGTASVSANFVLCEWTDFPQELRGRDLRLTGCPQGGSSSGYRIAMHSKANSTASYAGIGADIGDGVDVTTSKQYCRVLIGIGANTDVDGLTFYPMLRYADITDDTYEPYKPSVEERLNDITDQIFGIGETIPSGADLNAYTTAGVYYAQNVAVSDTLLNNPHKEAGFRLEVCYQNTNKRFIQKLIPNSASGVFFHRVYTSVGFSSWYKFSGEEVTI